jgi:hypothetical protein
VVRVGTHFYSAATSFPGQRLRTAGRQL